MLAKLLIIAIIICTVWWFYGSESFSTRNEKYSTILDWFNNNPRPTYKQFRAEIPTSDIVEYELLYKLYRAGELNPTNAAKILADRKSSQIAS